MLINSEMASPLNYSFVIYKWPVNLLHKINTAMRNFLWTSRIDKTKLVSIVWEKNVLPYTIYGFS